MATHVLDLTKAEIPGNLYGLLPEIVPLKRTANGYEVAENEITLEELAKLRRVRQIMTEFYGEAPIIVSRTKLLPGAKIRKIKE